DGEEREAPERGGDRLRLAGRRRGGPCRGDAPAPAHPRRPRPDREAVRRLALPLGRSLGVGLRLLGADVGRLPHPRDHHPTRRRCTVRRRHARAAGAGAARRPALLRAPGRRARLDGARRRADDRGAELAQRRAHRPDQDERLPRRATLPVSSADRQLGVDLFNATWRLIESRDDDDLLVHTAHASAYHWAVAPECEPENRARSEWLLSRVYTLVGRPDAALDHAERCLQWCAEHGLGDWDLAYAHEALARANKL